MRNFATLKEFFIKHKWTYILGIFWLISVDLLQLLVPKILGAYTDELSAGAFEAKRLLLYSLVIAGLAIFMFIFRYLWRIYIMGAARLLEFKLRNKLYSHLQKMSTNYFNNKKTGDLMAHATNDINAVRMAAGPGIIMIVDAIVIIAIAVVLMAQTISFKLTLVALIPLPFITFATYKFGSMMHVRSRLIQESFSRVSERVQENLSGMRVIKSFVQEREEINKFEDANQDYVNKNMDFERVHVLFHSLVVFLAGLSLLIVLFYGGMLVINREITLGDFVAFNSYVALLTWPMMAIGRVVNILQRGAASMGRLNEIFETEPEIYDYPKLMNEGITEIKGEIIVKDLSFTYPGTSIEVLNNININLPQGNTLAIIGKTGSGKTTLTNLLLRLYNNEQGVIQIDGHELKTIPLEVLRDNIGYVPQDNFLFSTTIRENIAFGIDEFDDEMIVQAAKAANIYDDISEFPEQFETMVGERGVSISGGQKQRISIARALIKKPSILILDDSLSAVDTKTEEEILDNLLKLRGNLTTINISHRVSTIKEADEIIVLDEGTIIERGTHEELLRLRGSYFELYEKQLLEDMIANQ
jgi:ATP-binding cassette subfamily B protein